MEVRQQRVDPTESVSRLDQQIRAPDDGVVRRGRLGHRLERPHGGRADRDDAAVALAPRLDRPLDRPPGRGIDQASLLVHRMPVQVVHLDRLEGPRPHLERDLQGLDARESIRASRSGVRCSPAVGAATDRVDVASVANAVWYQSSGREDRPRRRRDHAAVSARTEAGRTPAAAMRVAIGSGSAGSASRTATRTRPSVRHRLDREREGRRRLVGTGRARGRPGVDGSA